MGPRLQNWVVLQTIILIFERSYFLGLNITEMSELFETFYNFSSC